MASGSTGSVRALSVLSRRYASCRKWLLVFIGSRVSVPGGETGLESLPEFKPVDAPSIRVRGVACSLPGKPFQEVFGLLKLPEMASVDWSSERHGGVDQCAFARAISEIALSNQIHFFLLTIGRPGNAGVAQGFDRRQSENPGLKCSSRFGLSRSIRRGTKSCCRQAAARAATRVPPDAALWRDAVARTWRG